MKNTEKKTRDALKVHLLLEEMKYDIH